MSKKTQLTEKQSNFVLNYIKNGCNAKQAALAAGYTMSVAKVKGTSMLANPLIKERLAQAYSRIERQEIEALCMSIKEKASILSSIIYDVIPKDGTEPKRDYYKDAIKAIQELNKMSGDYAPDKRLSLTVDATKERLLEAKRVYEEY